MKKKKKIINKVLGEVADVSFLVFYFFFFFSFYKGECIFDRDDAPFLFYFIS